MPTNSHIQCSKFIIKQFNICESNGHVYTLDLTNGSIEERSPNQIGTSIDYYKVIFYIACANHHDTAGYSKSLASFKNFIRFRKMFCSNGSGNNHYGKVDYNTYSKFCDSMFLQMKEFVEKLKTKYVLFILRMMLLWAVYYKFLTI